MTWNSAAKGRICSGVSSTERPSTTNPSSLYRRWNSTNQGISILQGSRTRWPRNSRGSLSPSTLPGARGCRRCHVTWKKSSGAGLAWASQRSCWAAPPRRTGANDSTATTRRRRQRQEPEGKRRANRHHPPPGRHVHSRSIGLFVRRKGDLRRQPRRRIFRPDPQINVIGPRISRATRRPGCGVPCGVRRRHPQVTATRLCSGPQSGTHLAHIFMRLPAAGPRDKMALRCCSTATTHPMLRPPRGVP